MIDAAHRAPVVARIESASDVAARLPSLSGVIAIPYLAGWSTRRFKDLATRIHGEIVRAVTSREMRKSGLAVALRGEIDECKRTPSSRGALSVVETCKRWTIDHRHDPDALEVLAESKDAVLDGAMISAVIDASTHFGEMGRSRVVGAMAERLLKWSSALMLPEGVSRVLAAAKDLPWEAPAHEDIAKAAVALERELFYEASPAERERFERAVNGSVADVVKGYAHHPRVAVLEHVARSTERAELLEQISSRAEAVFEIDPRLTYRLVAALASNPATPAEILHPFARADFWTKGVPEQQALDALLARAIGRVAQPENEVALSP